MRSDIQCCPCLLQLIDQIRSGHITSKYMRELFGVDVTIVNQFEPWLGDLLLKFQNEVRGPFISAILRELETRIDDESMKILSSLDRIVLPMAVLELPARFNEFKSKSAAAAKKIAKRKAL